jgi:hypothetical protein
MNFIQIDPIDAMEWAGAILGLLGAFLLATHTRFSRYGWWAFLAANIALGAFAIGIGRNGLLLQQVGFVATSLLGIFRSWKTGQKPSLRPSFVSEDAELQLEDAPTLSEADIVGVDSQAVESKSVNVEETMIHAASGGDQLADELVQRPSFLKRLKSIKFGWLGKSALAVTLLSIVAYFGYAEYTEYKHKEALAAAAKVAKEQAVIAQQKQKKRLEEEKAAADAAKLEEDRLIAQENLREFNRFKEMSPAPLVVAVAVEDKNPQPTSSTKATAPAQMAAPTPVVPVTPVTPVKRVQVAKKQPKPSAKPANQSVAITAPVAQQALSQTHDGWIVIRTEAK